MRRDSLTFFSLLNILLLFLHMLNQIISGVDLHLRSRRSLYPHDGLLRHQTRSKLCLCLCFLVFSADGLVADADPPFSLVVGSGKDLEEASSSALTHPLDGVVNLIGLLRPFTRDGEDGIALLERLDDVINIKFLQIDDAEHQAVFLDMLTSMSPGVPQRGSTLVYFEPSDALLQGVASTFHELDCRAVAQVGHPHEDIAAALEHTEVHL